VAALAVRDTLEPVFGEACPQAFAGIRPNTLMSAIQSKAGFPWACKLAQKGKRLHFERMLYSLNISTFLGSPTKVSVLISPLDTLIHPTFFRVQQLVLLA
jgi:hypothetical protein